MHCKPCDLHLNLPHTSPRAGHVPRAGVSPCSSPMRNLEEVMKTRWADVTWVSSGVRTVRNPQADADRRRTFSPPILEDRKHVTKNKRRAKGQSPPAKAQALFPVQPVFKNNVSVKPVPRLQMSLALWGVGPAALSPWQQDTGRQRCPSSPSTPQCPSLTEGKPKMLSLFCFS